MKWTDEEIKKVRIRLEKYIDDSEIPIVSEFAYLSKIGRQQLYTFAEKNELFSDTIKRCIEKKETQLERLGLLNIINPSVAIFSLKQLGWKDKQEITTNDTSNIEIKFVRLDD